MSCSQDPEADELYGKPARRDNADSPKQGGSPSGSDVEDIFATLGSDEESEQEEDENQSEEEEAEDLEALQRTVKETLGPAVERRRKARTVIQDEAVPESQYNLSAGQLLIFCFEYVAAKKALFAPACI